MRERAPMSAPSRALTILSPSSRRHLQTTELPSTVTTMATVTSTSSPSEWALPSERDILRIRVLTLPKDETCASSLLPESEAWGPVSAKSTSMFEVVSG